MSVPGAWRGWRYLLLGALLLQALGPLALLVVASLAEQWFWPALLPTRWGAASWLRMLDPSSGRLATATLNSLVLAVGTGAVASAAGLTIGRSLARLRGWRSGLGAAAAFAPVAAPPVALAVGLQYTALSLGLAGSLAGVLLAHLVPALGYTTLLFLGVFAVYDEGLEEEARTLGATRWQVRARVTLPLLRRPLTEAFVLAFLVSWAQVPLTLLVGQGLVPTLSVEVLSFARAGQDRLAATGALLLVAPALLVMATARLAVRRSGVVPA